MTWVIVLINGENMRQILRNFILLTICLVLLASTSLLGCSNTKTKVSSNLPTIVVGIDNFNPYSYLDNDGNYAGIDVELATEAFKRIGYEASFEVINWEDKNNLLNSGEIDCIWSCYTMTGREDKYEWAGPYMYSRQVVAVKSTSDINELSDLADKRIGVQVTTKAMNLFLHIDESDLPEVKQVNCFATTEDVFASLRKGYVDAISGHEALINTFIQNSNGAYRLLEESPYTSELGVAFKKGTHAEIVESLNTILEEMKEDGTFARIVRKYGLDENKVIWEGESK